MFTLRRKISGNRPAYIYTYTEVKVAQYSWSCTASIFKNLRKNILLKTKVFGDILKEWEDTISRTTFIKNTASLASKKCKTLQWVVYCK